MAKENTAGKIIQKDDPALSGCKNETAGEFSRIIQGCRENNPESQERLYKKYYGYVLGVALAYCVSREDAAEVANDSFIKVFRHIGTYIHTKPFRPWIRRIVVNTAIDKLRAVRKFNCKIEIGKIEPLSPVDIESELNASQIFKLLNELPDLLRFVFNMYEIEGYSHREIAEQLDIAESSSRTYLGRAKSRLRQLYTELFMDEQ